MCLGIFGLGDKKREYLFIGSCPPLVKGSLCFQVCSCFRMSDWLPTAGIPNDGGRKALGTWVASYFYCKLSLENYSAASKQITTVTIIIMQEKNISGRKKLINF